MEELMTVEEYVKKCNKKGISKYIVRQWIANGMRHIGNRPFLIKEAWVEEYIENTASYFEKPLAKTKTKPKIKKLPTKFRGDMKIRIEDLA